jgi:plastocyanin
MKIQARCAVVAVMVSVGMGSVGLEGQAAGTGTIKGVIRTAVKAPTALLKVTADQNVCGASLPDESLVLGPNGTVANAVIIVNGTTGGAASAGTIITNRKCAFVPRVQTAVPRSNTAVTSEDPMLHNTHAYDEKDYSLFNIALPKPGLKVMRPVRDAGVVTVKCDVHAWMRGFMVVTNELAAVSGAAGAFEIANVPGGAQTVRVWHEQLKAAPRTVTIKPGATTTVEFTLTN